ncbi:MAG: competence/damage-inducible protein A [Ignavibacteriae bacterium]|nr:MAG: competence/damage-inducible protein A [Ignavibacteriota bacterium]
MKAVIISIGDELVIGQVINTNASFLSKSLFSIGVSVDRVVTVPDDESTIIKEIHSAFKTSDVVVVTGGLGPTHDDITIHCLAKFFKSRLVLNHDVLRNVKSLYRRRKIKMPETNIRQAMLPEAAEILRNKVGTAPGLLLRKNGKILVSMPGVPHEMVYITNKHLLPLLKKEVKSGRTLKEKTLHTIGISESMLSKRIGNIDDIIKSTKKAVVKLAFLPANFEVRLRVTVDAVNPKTADRELKLAVKKLISRAGRFIYSYSEEQLEEVTGKLLRERKLKLSAAESCTGGLVSSKITNVSGSSEYFLDGIITYTNEAKIKFLGVRKDTLKKYGAVSEQTAMEMAEGARKSLGADIGISTTGIAGPTGATKTKPVGLVWIGYSDKDITFAKEFIFTKDRLRNKEVMAKMALEVLRRKLLAMSN